MKAIIFDVDGVLIDVSGSYRMTILKTAEYFLKKQVDPEIIQRLKNRGNFNDDYDVTRKIILLGSKFPNDDEVKEKFDEFYWGENNDGFVQNESWILHPDILRKLYGRYKLGIVTGRPKKDMDYALNRFATKSFFETVITLEDMQDKKKPDPYGLQLALNNLKTEDAIYIGDCVDDIKMAKGAGIEGIGVIPPGHGDELKEVLLEAGAQEVLNNINELQNILK
ncbi:HAD-IA family hydrolase [Nanoarchaeota archaeon]